MQSDTLRHQGLRRMLVDEVRSKGINDERVLRALSNVARHLFMDTAFLNFAYQDKAFPIDCEQTISQPYTVAYQTQLLDPQKGEKVLEIGTGSGYQTAVLAECGMKVFTIERHRPLYEKAKSLLSGLNYTQVKFFFGDGFKGVPASAPYDKIIVTCGAPEVPKELLAQLRTGGLMVIPVGPLDTQVMKTVLKKGPDEYEIIDFENFRFVPMLKEKKG